MALLKPRSTFYRSESGREQTDLNLRLAAAEREVLRLSRALEDQRFRRKQVEDLLVRAHKEIGRLKDLVACLQKDTP